MREHSDDAEFMALTGGGVVVGVAASEAVTGVDTGYDGGSPTPRALLSPLSRSSDIAQPSLSSPGPPPRLRHTFTPLLLHYASAALRFRCVPRRSRFARRRAAQHPP
jgi:hypothetical protein